MASATPIARRPSTHRHEAIRSEDWPKEVDESHPKGPEEMEFSGDGLNTGVRVLSW